MKKLNFAFDVTGLESYVEHEQDRLRAVSVLQGKTLSKIQVLDGQKGTTELSLLDDTINYQSGSTCTISPSGDTLLTDKTLTVVDIALVKSFCMKTLSGYFAQGRLVAGASAETQSLPFEEQIVEHIMAKHSAALDQAIWISDSALSSGNNQFFDGFKTLMDADASVLEANTTGVTAITNSNAYAVFLSVARTIPEQVLDSGEAVMFCGRADFDALKDNLFTLNLYHVGVANQHDDEMILPATGVKVISVGGLNGTSSIYGGKASAFIFGTDLASDYELGVEVWYSKDDDVVYMRNRFRAGCVYPFSAEMVKHTLAPS